MNELGLYAIRAGGINTCVEEQVAGQMLKEFKKRQAVEQNVKNTSVYGEKSRQDTDLFFIIKILNYHA